MDTSFLLATCLLVARALAPGEEPEPPRDGHIDQVYACVAELHPYEQFVDQMRGRPDLGTRDHYDRYLDHLVAGYFDAFTLDELRELAVFTSTAVGRRYQAHLAAQCDEAPSWPEILRAEPPRRVILAFDDVTVRDMQIFLGMETGNTVVVEPPAETFRLTLVSKRMIPISIAIREILDALRRGGLRVEMSERTLRIAPGSWAQ